MTWTLLLAVALASEAPNQAAQVPTHAPEAVETYEVLGSQAFGPLAETELSPLATQWALEPSQDTGWTQRRLLVPVVLGLISLPSFPIAVYAAFGRSSEGIAIALGVGFVCSLTAGILVTRLGWSLGGHVPMLGMVSLAACGAFVLCIPLLFLADQGSEGPAVLGLVLLPSIAGALVIGEALAQALTVIRRGGTGNKAPRVQIGVAPTKGGGQVALSMRF